MSDDTKDQLNDVPEATESSSEGGQVSEGGFGGAAAEGGADDVPKTTAGHSAGGDDRPDLPSKS